MDVALTLAAPETFLIGARGYLILRSQLEIKIREGLVKIFLIYSF